MRLSAVVLWGMLGVPFADALAAPGLSLVVRDPLVLGQTASLRVTPVDLPPDAVVTLLASTRPAQGPCTPTGVCQGVAAPLHVVDRYVAPPGVYDVALFVPPSVIAGRPVYLQAVARANGVVIAASDTVSEVVQAPRGGCMDPAFANFDPMAQVDDGTCACRLVVSPRTAAELAESLGCAHLDALYLDAYSEPTAALPDLVSVGTLSVQRNAALVALALPALTAAERVVLERSPSLAALDLSALAAVDDLRVANTGLTAVSLPRLAAAGDVHVGGRPITDLELPALVDVHDLVVHDTAIPALSLPSLREAWMLWISQAPLLHVELPAMQTLRWLTLSDLPDLVAIDTPPVVIYTYLQLDGRLGAAPQNTSGTPMTDLSITTRDTTLVLPGWTEAGAVTLGSGMAFDVSLPDLQAVRVLTIASGDAPHAIDLPALQTIGQLCLIDNEGLTSLTLPAASFVGGLAVHDNPGLAALHLPALTDVVAMEVDDNDSLVTLDLPLLTCDGWTGTFVDNPQLCVTTELPVGQAPGTCAAVGSGNQCDP